MISTLNTVLLFRQPTIVSSAIKSPATIPLSKSSLPFTTLALLLGRRRLFSGGCDSTPHCLVGLGRRRRRRLLCAGTSFRYLRGGLSLRCSSRTTSSSHNRRVVSATPHSFHHENIRVRQALGRAVDLKCRWMEPRRLAFCVLRLRHRLIWWFVIVVDEVLQVARQ